MKINKKFKASNGYIVAAEHTFTNSYATGGEAVTPDDVGLEVIEQIIPSPASGYVFEYDAANGKLKAYYADYDAVADGAFIEVAEAVDLSSVTVQLMVIGY